MHPKKATPALGLPESAGRIAVAAAMASATASYAAPVRFENDTFHRWSRDPIDLTLPSAAQYRTGNLLRGTQIDLDFFRGSSNNYSDFWYYDTGWALNFFYTEGGAETLSYRSTRYGYGVTYVQELQRGDLIGNGTSDADWSNSARFGFTEVTYDIDDYVPGVGAIRSNPELSVHGPFAPDGTPRYMGVRLLIDGNTHYGWISVAHTTLSPYGGWEMNILAWGYETEAGVAIGAGVPAPGALGVLALGAAGALRRKRAA